MGDPIGILVEDRVVQIARLELEISVDDRFYLVVLFHNIEPLQHTGLEFIIGLILWLVLHIEHRRQVAILQFRHLQEVIGLLFGWRMDAVEMIGSTSKTVLTGLIEILSEILIRLGSALRRLDHDKTDGTLVNHTLVFQFVPVDTALMVGDVNAVNLIAFWIGHITIEGTPTETKG